MKEKTSRINGRTSQCNCRANIMFNCRKSPMCLVDFETNRRGLLNRNNTETAGLIHLRLRTIRHNPSMTDHNVGRDSPHRTVIDIRIGITMVVGLTNEIINQSMHSICLSSLLWPLRPVHGLWSPIKPVDWCLFTIWSIPLILCHKRHAGQFDSWHSMPREMECLNG